MKKYKHWNDGKCMPVREPFYTGKIADEIKRDFIMFVLNDFEPTDMSNTEKTYIHDRFNKAISMMEDISYILRDANAINAMYGIDYEQRRERWNDAKGLCFRLMGLLDDICVFVPHIKNKQKYADISEKLFRLSKKIYNLIISDDKKKKKNCKQYLGND